MRQLAVKYLPLMKVVVVPQHGLGTSTNSLTTVGTITTNDTEGDGNLWLINSSGSGGGNTSQTNPSNNPFQVAIMVLYN